ncbi:MAG: Holliday junction resolvase RuvX [Campylobacterales bacterium]
MEGFALSKRIAAVDVGLKRIGVAVLLVGVELPLNPILRKNRDQAAADLSKILAEHRIDLLVVGLPMEGASSDEMQRRIRHFVGLLDFQGEIVYVNEWGSSKEVASMDHGLGIKERGSGKADSLAALIILRRYLDYYKG